MRTKTIMVVEDELIVAEDLTRWLISLGYTIAARAAAGREAVQRCEATRPDLVLMDILLPGDMDGIQAAEEIRRRFDIPVVFITASSDDATLARAKVSEPFGYILKPFDERGLYSTIEMALYKHQSEKRMRESEERFRLLFENAPVPFQSLDADGHILRVNKAWLELFGYLQDEVIGRWFGEFLTPGSIDRFVTTFTRFKSSPVLDVVTLDILLKDGSVRAGEFKGSIAVDHRGMFEMTQCVLESRKRPSSAEGMSPIAAGSVVVGSDGKVLGISPAFETLTGWGTDDVCGRPMKDLFVAAGEGEEILLQLTTAAVMESRPFRLRGKGIGPIEVLITGIAYRGQDNRTETMCIFVNHR
jgi:PAS domain S-box-containing protein